MGCGWIIANKKVIKFIFVLLLTEPDPPPPFVPQPPPLPPPPPPPAPCGDPKWVLDHSTGSFHFKEVY